MKNKSGAMEMTVGTIVTIVLLMSALVLGLILTKNVFGSAKGAIDLTDQELTSQIGKAFGSEDKELAFYPTSGELTIKLEEREAMGFGIKNLGTAGTNVFSYKVSVVDDTKCGASYDASKWIYSGASENNMAIPTGKITTAKVFFEIPSGAPICLVTYKVEVYKGSTPGSAANIYKSEKFYITSKA